MITFKKNKKWKPIHINMNLDELDGMEVKIRTALNSKLNEYQIDSWKTIDIIKFNILSVTSNKDNTKNIDVLVIVSTDEG